MTASDAQIDVELRRRVVETVAAELMRLLERDEPVTEEMRMTDELGLNSSLGLELLLGVEERLSIQIDVETMNPDQLRTVGELATFIAGHNRPW